MSYLEDILNADLPGNFDAVFHPAGGSSVDCRVMFYNPAAAVSVDGGLVPSSQALAQGLESVFSGAKLNDYIVIDGNTWYIIGIMPDGNGIVNLDLGKQAVQNG
jgi:hypothetical protein